MLCNIRAIVRSEAAGLSSAMYDFIDARSAFAVSEYSISKAVHLPNLLFSENRVWVRVGMPQGGLYLGFFPCQIFRGGRFRLGYSGEVVNRQWPVVGHGL
jgi:hypothetical protein